MSEDHTSNDDLDLQAELSGEVNDADISTDGRETVVDFDPNGLLLKIATDVFPFRITLNA